ncbi:C10 family peptidase [Taibaiella helva]|uniref:C10 family peptidase n=1 Tax=Taibaiella helva TaxID=2301235 RepID=UPI00130090AE|nr:C10 family peptidase [Taibaiella helva]
MTIISTLTLNNSNNIPSLYIFNYANDGGYVVMPADCRFEPISAFVEKGNLGETEKIPPALAAWFLTTRAIIEGIRNGEMADAIDDHRASWVQMGALIPAVYENRVLLYLKVLENARICFPDLIQLKEPLVNNNWGQGCSYNNLIPVGGCSMDCGKALTGCVATAGAILSHYWAAPSTALNYNYAAMDRNNGDTGVQRLMLNIGQTVHMDWNCGESSADTKDLRNFYRYYLYYNAFGEYDDFDNNTSRWTIKGDIDAGRPVILDGCTENATLFHWSYGACHAWICDGYRQYSNPCRSSSFHFHMNWGWDGSNTGYFFQAGEWPAGSVFQYERSILHNVHP